MASETIDRPYDLMASQAQANDRLPRPEELEEIYSALHGVHEHLVRPLKEACIALANSEDEGGASFEDIGRLLAFVDDVLAAARWITRDAEDIALIVRHTFPALAHGWRSDGVPFSDHGYIEKPREYAQLRRAYGFREAANVTAD